MKTHVGICFAAALCGAASVAARADFSIAVDMSADPIKDVRTSTCGPEVGYAGCNFPIDGPNEPADTYWFKTRAADTSRAMREAGYDAIPMAAYEGMKPAASVLTVEIAPHTVQSVTVLTRNAPDGK